MKKGLILIFVLIVMLSSFVNAGFLDFLTGRQVKENEMSCIDSDGGLNYNIQGYISLIRPKSESVKQELDEKLEAGRITKEQYDEAVSRLGPIEVVDRCSFLEEPVGTYANFIKEGYCIDDKALFTEPAQWTAPIKTYDCLKENKLCFDGRCEYPGETGYLVRLRYDFINKISQKVRLYGKTISIKDITFEDRTPQGDTVPSILIIAEIDVDGISVKSSDCLGPCEINGLNILLESKFTAFMPNEVEDMNRWRISLIVSPIDNIKEPEPNLIIKNAKKEKSILYWIYVKLFGKFK